MDSKHFTIDSLLENFLQSEVAATDKRIVSIRHFLEALQKEVVKYTTSPINTNSNISKTSLAKLIDDMAEIYNDELSHLLTKRNKIYNHLTSVHIAICNGESAKCKGLYIN